METLEKEVLVWKPIDRRRLVEKAKAIYEKIREQLEAEHLGKVVLIEVDSGDYFIGKTGLEAYEQAKKKYPDKLFYGIRIGRRAYASFKGIGGKR
ncbi:MAG: hypothetical protein ONB05_04460 [candidate division KSB1 bacterium]|nr:hypothetical protein [candidate division KSB1 bacterium]